jgi:NADH:ubiquinone oxidoreductase subunit 6 (subunit J)
LVIVAIFFSILIWGAMYAKRALQRLWPSRGLGAAVGNYLLLLIVAQAGITVSYFCYFGGIERSMGLDDLIGLDLVLCLWFPLAAAACLLLVGAVVDALKLRPAPFNNVFVATSFLLYFGLLMFIWSRWHDELARLARLTS